MQKNIINRTIKNTIVLILIFFSILFLLFYLFFSDFKEKAFINAKFNYELNIDKYTNKFKEPVILFNKLVVNQYIKDAKNTGFINNVKIKYNKILLNKENLIFQTNDITDSSWNLADVTTDIKFGEIKKIDGTSFFEFIPSSNFNLNEKLLVKYQLFRNYEIKNFMISIDLNLLNNQDIVDNDKEIFSFYKYFYNMKLDESITRELKIGNINFATIEYVINDYNLKEEIYTFFNKLLILVLISFFPMLIVIVFYNKYIEKKYLIEPIKYLDEIVLNIIEHKFSNINNEVINHNIEYKNLLLNISKLSNKMASLVNELNINRESMERNLLTDNLTGLYDKKMFDIDMKSMFVSSFEGYIFLLKIAKLDQIESLNGTVKTDDFILSYVNIINNIIHTYRNEKISFYRFHGAEFIILAKDLDYSDAIDFSDKVINSLVNEISKNYKLPTNIFHIGGTPIDKYGTIDSILNLVNNIYKEAVLKNENSYAVIEKNKIFAEVEKTEKKVRYIIDNNYFDISFAFDSYSFENELLMRELKPILKDSEGNILPIGSFIAISEKLKLNKTFDEQVILKALYFIENNKIEYKIAINLSIKTILDIEFIEFLNKLVNANKSIVNNILFSITSYTASVYKKQFVEFVKQLNKLNFEILIKRFKTKEYSIEELSKLKINYLKIDKDLTQNIHMDLIKKHRIKNIIVYAEVNEVKIIVENVELDQDYKFLSKLDLYAVNR
jgi:EAL domain-containing protein (putative c-di-GMP-specific phosphodiesterase class I)/GGDEF domain-containing protein